VRDCRVQNLFVIARTSSFTYKGKAVDVKWVGRELGVRYVLEGSVRKAGNRVRITGQLINTQLPGTTALGAKRSFVAKLTSASFHGRGSRSSRSMIT
jgi:TolB-like protein